MTEYHRGGGSNDIYFPPFWRLGNPRSRRLRPGVWWEPASWFLGSCSLAASFMWWKRWGTRDGYSSESWGLHPHDWLTSQRPHLQILSHWGLGFNTRIWGCIDLIDIIISYRHNHSVYSTSHMLVLWSLNLPLLHWGHDLNDAILYFLPSPPNAPGLIPNSPSLDACACVAQSLQSRSTLCDPMGCSPPGSSVHGILLAKILGWVVTPSSRGFSQFRDGTGVSYASCITGGFFIHWATGEAPRCSSIPSYPSLALSRLPGVLVVKNLPAYAEDGGSISGLGRSPGGGHGNPFQYFWLDPIDRGAWWATVHGVTKSRTWLSK